MKKLIWMLKNNVEYMVFLIYDEKKRETKLARTTKFHITPLGPNIYIYISYHIKNINNK